MSRISRGVRHSWSLRNSQLPTLRPGELTDNQTAIGVRLFLRDNIVHHVSVDVGQSVVASLMAVG